MSRVAVPIAATGESGSRKAESGGIAVGRFALPLVLGGALRHDAALPFDGLDRQLAVLFDQLARDDGFRLLLERVWLDACVDDVDALAAVLDVEGAVRQL